MISLEQTFEGEERTVAVRPGDFYVMAGSGEGPFLQHLLGLKELQMAPERGDALHNDTSQAWLWRHSAS